MDPVEAYHVLTDTSNPDTDERLACGDALIHWIAGGGFIPPALYDRVRRNDPHVHVKPWLRGYCAALGER